jgi:EmrB/QacA subfamily drug resistance transporter
MAGQVVADAVTLGWISSAYIIAAAILIVPFGKYADIVGRKKIFLAGVFLFTIASLACAAAPSAPLLIALRFVQGIGGAMIFGTSLAIVTQVFGPGERGAAIGITIATVYAGLSAGPFLGGVLTEMYGWPAIFLINVPIGFLTVLITCKAIPHEWADASGDRFDTAGALLFSFTLFCAINGMLMLPGRYAIFLFLLALAAAGAFWYREQRVPYPLIDPAVFSKNRTFVFSNIAAMINYGATFGVGILLSLYLQYIRGFSAETAGLILIAQPVVQMCFSPLAGRLSDRVEPRIVATAGMAITTLGLASFVFLDPDSSLLLIIGSLIVLGLGYGLFSSPNTNAIMSSVERRYLGIAAGMNATMRSLGQLMSMAIAMVAFAVFIGPVPITPEIYPSLMQSTIFGFGVFAVLGGIGIAASLVRGTIHT